MTLLLAAGLVGFAQAEIPEHVRIGGIFDVTGNWSFEGEEAKTTTEIAINDFNEYLNMTGAGWSFVMHTEDSQANASVALDKIQTLNSLGIDLIVGMAFSSHLQLAKSYVDASDMLVISHGSQTVNLAIDDSIFRLVSNDGNQAVAISTMLKDAGIEVLGTVNRADAWGDGLVYGVAQLFEGQTVEILRYNPDAVDFSVEISLLDQHIADLIDMHGADKVGVLYVGTNEFTQMILSMNLYESISKVRWFTSSVQANSGDLLDNEDTVEFVEKVKLTATRWVSDTNSLSAYVDSKIYETYNRTKANAYSYPAYDAIWLLGYTILHTQSTDPLVLENALPLVANHMMGSVGHLKLDEFGDLSGVSHDIVQIQDGAWVTIDRIASTGE